MKNLLIKCSLAIALCLTILCGGCSLPFQKYTTYEILSGSMKASGFEIGDKVLLKQVDTDNLKPNHIIAFYYYHDIYDDNFEKLEITDFNNPPFADSDEINFNQRTTKEELKNDSVNIYFHHITKVFISEEGIRFFQTKGSSNAYVDALLIREDFVIGRYYKKV